MPSPKHKTLNFKIVEQKIKKLKEFLIQENGKKVLNKRKTVLLELLHLNYKLLAILINNNEDTNPQRKKCLELERFYRKAFDHKRNARLKNKMKLKITEEKSKIERDLNIYHNVKNGNKKKFNN